MGIHSRNLVITISLGVSILVLSLASPCHSEGLEIVVSAAEGLPGSGKGPVVIVVWRGEDAPQWYGHLEASPEGSLVLDHRCQLDEQVLVMAGGLVGGPVVVEPGKHCVTGGGLHVELVHGGRLTGALEVEGARLPSWGWVEAETCPAPGEPVEIMGRFPLTLGDDGSFSVVLPAGCLSWRVSSPGLSSTKRPGLRLGLQENRQVGTVTLRPAGRVEVEVRDLESGFPVAGAEVFIVPEERLGEVCDSEARPNFSRFPGSRTGSSGWVEFSTVAPGNYLVVVDSRDHATGLGPMVGVAAGESTTAAKTLGPPGGVMVELGDLALLAEVGRKWAVEVTPVAGEVGIHACARRVEFSRGFPFLVLEDLAAGSWLAGVDLEIQGIRFEVGNSRVEVVAGTTVPADLDISENVVRGRIEYKRAPVEASFDLMNRGTPSRFVVSRAKTNEEGAFVALVPEPGVYDVHIRPAEPSLGYIVVPAIDFPCDGSDVLIRVPSGRIEGRVVDSMGDPVPKASANAIWLGPGHDDPDAEAELVLANARADSGGLFEMEGLVAGRWQVSAREGPGPGARRSIHEVISLEEGSEVRDVLLELKESESFKGRVVTQTGRPAGDILVVAFVPPSAPGMHIHGAEVRTDGEGLFEIPMGPVQPPWVNLQVGSPPLATVALRTPVTEDLEITLPEQGGTVLLRWPPAGTDRRPPAHEIAVVSESGGVISAAGLPFRFLPASEENPEPGFVVGPLAPGSWRVLRAPATRGALDALWAGGGGLPLVAEVSVFPGAVTTIER